MSESPRRITRQSSKSPSRNKIKAVEKTNKKGNAKELTTSRQQKSNSKSTVPKDRSRSRSTNRNRTKQVPSKDTKQSRSSSATSRTSSSKAASSVVEDAFLKEEESVVEPSLKREFFMPLEVRDNNSNLVQRKPVHSGEASSMMKSYLESPKLMKDNQCNAFTFKAQAHVSKFRYLYGVMIIMLLMICLLCYTGYKVEEGIKKVQNQVNDYVINRFSSYLSKENAMVD